MEIQKSWSESEISTGKLKEWVSEYDSECMKDIFFREKYAIDWMNKNKYICKYESMQHMYVYINVCRYMPMHENVIYDMFTNCIEASVATTIATDDAWIAAAITANDCATIRLMMSSTGD